MADAKDAATAAGNGLFSQARRPGWLGGKGGWWFASKDAAAAAGNGLFSQARRPGWLGGKGGWWFASKDAAAAVKPTEAAGAGNMLSNMTKASEGIFGRVGQHGGWVNAIKDGGKQIIGQSPAHWGVRVGRGGGVAVGAVIAGDALFRGKKSDGENRGAVGRIVQFIVGGGVAVGSLAIGKGRI